MVAVRVAAVGLPVALYWRVPFPVPGRAVSNRQPRIARRGRPGQRLIRRRDKYRPVRDGSRRDHAARNHVIVPVTTAALVDGGQLSRAAGWRNGNGRGCGWRSSCSPPRSTESVPGPVPWPPLVMVTQL